MNHPSEAPSSSPNPTLVPCAAQMPSVLPVLPPPPLRPSGPPLVSLDDLEPEPELEPQESSSGPRTPRVPMEHTPVDSSAQIVAAAVVEQALRPFLHSLRQIEDRVTEVELRVASASRPLDDALAHALDGNRRRRRVVLLATVLLATAVGGPLILLIARYAGLYAG